MVKTIKLSGRDRAYDIICGNGILQDFTKYFPLQEGGTAAIISDSNVSVLYLDKLIKALKGYKTISYVFPAGEPQKTLATCSDIYNFLTENNFSRTDTLIALGGGVVGDITGFAAATYLRGVKYYSIPTTLLAQVDSSVGGKCGVDISGGKNLVGAFYQPFGVLCDSAFLSTLPKEQYTSGMAEVVKYAFIYDAGLLKNALNMADNADSVIARCVEIKRDIVQKDEFDDGERMTLNFGHTIGHAAETLGGYTAFLHGYAVAAGMAYAAKLSHKWGLCPADTVNTVIESLTSLGLPVTLPFTAEQLLPVVLGDKKVRSGGLNFILLSGIGSAVIKKVPTNDVGVALRLAME